MKNNNGINWLMLKCVFLNHLSLMARNSHSNINSNDDNNLEKLYYLLNLTQFKRHSLHH